MVQFWLSSCLAKGTVYIHVHNQGCKNITTVYHSVFCMNQVTHAIFTILDDFSQI